MHANVAYTVLGKPSGVSVKNTWSFALAGDYKINPKWDVFGEVMYITSGRGSSNDNGSGDTADGGNVTAVKTSGEGGDSLTSGTAIAEIGGVEIIGTLGVRHHLTEHVDVFGSFSYDNADAKLFRTGFTVKF